MLLKLVHAPGAKATAIDELSRVVVPSAAQLLGKDGSEDSGILVTCIAR